MSFVTIIATPSPQLPDNNTALVGLIVMVVIFGGARVLIWFNKRFLS